MAAAASYALPRAQRIRKRADFVRIQDSAVRVTTPHVVLLFAPRAGGGPARLGVVASKKVGCAIARNRAKRLAREFFRLHPDMFPEGLDVIIVARAGAHELVLADLEAELHKVAPLVRRRTTDLLRAATRAIDPMAR